MRQGRHTLRSISDPVYARILSVGTLELDSMLRRVRNQHFIIIIMPQIFLIVKLEQMQHT